MRVTSSVTRRVLAPCKWSDEPLVKVLECVVGMNCVSKTVVPRSIDQGLDQRALLRWRENLAKQRTIISLTYCSTSLLQMIPNAYGI